MYLLLTSEFDEIGEAEREFATSSVLRSLPSLFPTEVCHGSLARASRSPFSSPACCSRMRTRDHLRRIARVEAAFVPCRAVGGLAALEDGVMTTVGSRADEENPGRRYDFLSNATLIAMTSAAAGAADGLYAEAAQALGWILIGGVALRCEWRGGDGSWWPRTAASVTCLLAAAVLWVMDPHLRFVSVALCLAALRNSSQSGPLVPWVAWCRTIAIVTCWSALYTAWPGFHTYVRGTSRGISRALGEWTGAATDFGPLPLGVPVWLTACVLWATLTPRSSSERKRWVLVALVALPVLMTLHIIASRWASVRWLGPYVGFEAPAVHAALPTLIVVSALVAFAVQRFVAVEGSSRNGNLRPAWVGTALVVLALVVAWFPYPDTNERLRGRVLLYDRGYLAWSVPTHSSFGRDASGMFGLLPERLRYAGLEVDISSDLTAESLSDIDVLFTINLLDTIEPKSKTAVWSFVERGGTLVCLGDHTGLGGIREPFNDLLTPVGIEYQFDSAKPVGGDWGIGLRTFPSRVTAGMRNGDEMPIGVGASLVVPSTARVLVSGIRAFADAGDPTQKERGFLGDYLYNPGEPLGDLPIVACTSHGEGRVLVFGDTSPFQNGSFGQGELFIDNCMRWALGDIEFSSRRALASGCAAAILAFAACAFLMRGQAWSAAASIAFMPFALHQPWTQVESVQGSFEERWTPALIDASHGQAFDMRWWQDDSIGGLQLGLFRNGVWPRVEPDRFDLTQQKLLVMLAPTRAVDQASLDGIGSFLERGGVVLCTVGHEGGAHARRFLEEFGFTVGSTPLGPATAPALGGRVHFQCAYPIDSAPAGFRVLAEVYDRPVIGWMPIGGGAFVVVSDTRFLLNPNLENASEYVPENSTFLSNLIGHLRQEERL